MIETGRRARKQGAGRPDYNFNTLLLRTLRPGTPLAIKDAILNGRDTASGS